MVKIITSSTDIENLGLSAAKKNIIITKDVNSSRKLFSLVKDYSRALLLENSELLPFDFFSMAPTTRAKRISCLSSFLEENEITLVASISTLMSPVPDPMHLSPLNKLEVGKPFDPVSITMELKENGYVREDFVEIPGQFAVRGSVMDIYLTSYSSPVRVEYFDQKIETLRTFNPESQITHEKVNLINFLPSYEYPLNQKSSDIFKMEWRRNFDTFEEDSEIFSKTMKLKHAEGSEIYYPLFFGKKTSFLPYLKGVEGIFIQDGIKDKANEFSKLVDTRYEEYRYDQRRPLLRPDQLYLNFAEIKSFLADATEFSTDVSETIDDIDLKKDLKRNERADLSTKKLPDEDDLVVHLSHGIGRFKGLRQLDTFVGLSDCLEIEYLDDSKVFVPIENMDLVSKYYGPEDKAIDSLNSKRWKKKKEKALKQTFDTAAELLEVQAKRNLKTGYSYEIDEEDYQNFIKQFPYQETFDQKRTIDEVLNDMRSNKAMDRLVCGEVGFGKTEVALRAAFVAALNNKQTCVLVPTTLLTSQHLESFLQRFKDTGINVASISRNIAAKQKEVILDKLKSGEIDIVIGTHALIQGSVEFNDLGLLIIDEEHRFGVRQKEKIKTLKEEVEVLSLSATPIPRSLNFALSELKDLSIIATAPDDRLPIKTFTYSYNENLIHEAIQRETLRGGQVYYLCNDLNLIEDRKLRLQEKFLNLRIEVVHGQLKPSIIDEKMIDFNSGKTDILVCSTIIESGIDVSNANTLIVEDSDKFGLSQLHQLRGRVGRANKQAYAYFLRSKNIINKKNADKRFEALMSTDSLSSGFLLALKDLEIRGAGEILGSNQSGVFESIGLELYTRMIKKASNFIRDGELNFQSLDLNSEINLNKNSFIPEVYLPDVNVRLLMYNKIALAKTAADLKNIQVEMINRFGLLPNELKNFFLQAELKLVAEKNSVRKIDIKEKKVNIIFHNQELNTSFYNDESLDEKVTMTTNVIEAIAKNAT